MSGEMGTFRVDVEVENPLRPGERQVLRGVLVDTGAELSWFPTEELESLGIERGAESSYRPGAQAAGRCWAGAGGGGGVSVRSPSANRERGGIAPAPSVFDLRAARSQNRLPASARAIAEYCW